MCDGCDQRQASPRFCRKRLRDALQLADFLVKPLQTHSGIMALPDVYCLFNRARGTELVSPDDLLVAVGLFPKIGAPMVLRTFASGLLVVQSSSHSDAEASPSCCFIVSPRFIAVLQMRRALIACQQCLHSCGPAWFLPEAAPC